LTPFFSKTESSKTVSIFANGRPLPNLNIISYHIISYLKKWRGCVTLKKIKKIKSLATSPNLKI